MTSEQDAPPLDPIPVTVSEDEARAVAAALKAFAAALPDDRRADYARLAQDVAAGTIPADDVDAVERTCRLALETGHARRLGPDVELLLGSVMHRLPLGRRYDEQVRTVNKALETLTGREIRSARVSWRIPGHYECALHVEGFHLTIAFTPDAVEIRRLDAG